MLEEMLAFQPGLCSFETVVVVVVINARVNVSFSTRTVFL
jgi:hypothetical protein